MNPADNYNDNTRVSCYKDCPRKFLLRHVLNWRSSGTAIPLVFGSSWHAAMDIVWKHSQQLSKDDLVQGAMAAFLEKWTEEGLAADLDSEQLAALSPRTPAVAEEMIYHYIDARWNVLRDCQLVGCEQSFAVPLPGIPNSWYVGKLDKVIEYQGQKLIIEHKSTTIYKKDGGFQSSYIEGWYSDSQVKGYHFGGGLFYPGLSQIWVDCALVHKTVHDAFRFVPVAHAFPILKEWVEDTQSWITSMHADEEKFHAAGNRLTPGVFRKNENMCFGKFGNCSFLDICRTVTDPTELDGPPEGYVEEKWSPFDVLELDKVLNKE